MVSAVEGETSAPVMAEKFVSTMPADSKLRAREIKRVILEEEAKVRAAYPVLNHQDAIGLAIFAGSLALHATAAYYYLTGVAAWYVVVPVIAFAASLLHELEHDLIHNQYFKGQKWFQNFMFTMIWISKCHANPWWRRDIHHWHHRVSGQKNDIEERTIGLGMEIGWKRLGVVLHPQGFVRIVKDVKADAGDAMDLSYMNRGSLLPSTIIMVSMKLMMIASVLRFLGLIEAEGLYTVATSMTVLIIAPMILRQSCLVAMSTSSHYYGDIPENNVYFQNQILNHWSLYPFQAFCWGFGGTHIIHHYVPNQPFYLRSMIATPVWDEMIRQGVRNNDFGTMLRANRWNIKESQQKMAGLAAMLWFSSVIVFMSFFAYVYDVVVTPTLIKVLVLMLTGGKGKKTTVSLQDRMAMPEKNE